MNWYNTNETRGYPLDDTASGVSEAGERLPDGLLVDASLRWPAQYGRFAFISGIRTSSKSVSLVVSVSSYPDQGGTFLGILQLPQPITPYKPYTLRPLLDGGGGFVVFGTPALSTTFSGRFLSAAQAGLLPRSARPLHVTGVESVRLDGGDVLSGDIQLLGSGDLEVVSDTRVIEGETVPAVVFRLKDDALSTYIGPCGRRPDSRNCDPEPIETINAVGPDPLTGDLRIEFDGFLSEPVDHGVILNTEYFLPSACGLPDNNPPPPGDQCEQVTDPSETTVEHWEFINGEWVLVGNTWPPPPPPPPPPPIEEQVPLESPLERIPTEGSWRHNVQYPTEYIRIRLKFLASMIESAIIVGERTGGGGSLLRVEAAADLSMLSLRLVNGARVHVLSAVSVDLANGEAYVLDLTLGRGTRNQELRLVLSGEGQTLEIAGSRILGLADSGYYGCEGINPISFRIDLLTPE